ncbi:MAG: hypothetical protein BGO26_05120 [Actinobacteria bacterium 69-20]|nr:polyadenylate-specific 3'-exoribonuclease AS [Actinomycetota bacterium]OJV25278.1 MAG: hypothetical protein BGO26_05120 [Actinobacteria bacterium 69-20]
MTTARPGRRARYFYDCEFIEDGRTIDLVSIGIVCDDGREYYALSSEFDPTRAGPWVAAHVLPHLPRPSDESWRPRSAIRDEVLAFLTEPGLPIELWAWCAAYDHVALVQLWGDMTALPRAIPRLTYEIRQFWEMAGSPAVSSTGRDRHHALVDARLGFARFRAAEQALSRSGAHQRARSGAGG